MGNSQNVKTTAQTSNIKLITTPFSATNNAQITYSQRATHTNAKTIPMNVQLQWQLMEGNVFNNVVRMNLWIWTGNTESVKNIAWISHIRRAINTIVTNNALKVQFRIKANGYVLTPKSMDKIYNKFFFSWFSCSLYHECSFCLHQFPIIFVSKINHIILYF